jgi:hypothetical protein
MKSSYPFAGQIFPAEVKKFSELIFFVHFFEGNKKLLKRHIELVNSLGFDAFAFNLDDDFSLTRPPITSEGRLGYKHVFADQIERLLNDLPGDKIVYSFSNPTGAAIEAMARRGCSDIKGMIADSGPSGQFLKSVYNLYAQDKMQNQPLVFKLLATPILSLIWSPRLHGDLAEELAQFPKDFPILSIRGWKDPLISPDQIDQVFNPQTHLDWRKLALPEAGHLNGLRDFESDYVPAVRSFLREIATPVKETS